MIFYFGQNLPKRHHYKTATYRYGILWTERQHFQKENCYRFPTQYAEYIRELFI